jgi:hypothetical protein
MTEAKEHLARQQQRNDNLVLGLRAGNLAGHPVGLVRGRCHDYDKGAARVDPTSKFPIEPPTGAQFSVVPGPDSMCRQIRGEPSNIGAVLPAIADEDVPSQFCLPRGGETRRYSAERDGCDRAGIRVLALRSSTRDDAV